MGSEDTKVLDLVSMMGEQLLRNGADIARVQETMTIVGKAYHKENIDVYAVSNGIFVTMRHENETRCTQVKYVPIQAPDLGRVAAVNQLSREISHGKWSVDEALKCMKDIAGMKGLSFWGQMAAYAIASSSFCYLFGGSIADSLAAVPVGIILCLFQYLMRRCRISKMMQTIFSSGVVTLTGMLTAAVVHIFYPPLSVDKMIIGGLIILVPGMPLTTSVRDFFNGDYLSGTIRMIDALLVAVCMAIGVGMIYLILY
ncbi:MAG TPA: threonine/serine exporter family protein [Candidatus Scybalocola faecipullorum]|nr:threonine/serine exporter family protein [Candidatus Scybalocola faecipullorum]